MASIFKSAIGLYDVNMNRSLQVKAIASGLRMSVLQRLDAPGPHSGDQTNGGQTQRYFLGERSMRLMAKTLNVAQPTLSRQRDMLK